MAVTTYASVKPLLSRAEEGPRAIRCVFSCPVTQCEIDAVGPLAEGTELEDVCPGEEGLLSSLQNVLGGLFASVLGGSRPTLEVTRADDAEEGQAYTESERKAGIVLAFRTVANQFMWDPQAERWISLEGAGELLTNFDRLLRLDPIHDEADRRVAARMLVEVARADQQVTPTEWGFLCSFIPGDLSSVDTYMEAPALTPEELEATSCGAARESMLMLAWRAAQIDDHLDEKETAQLMGYATGLKIPAERAHELQGYAQYWRPPSSWPTPRARSRAASGVRRWP